MEDLIQYNLEVALRVPKGVQFTDVTVNIEIQPYIGSCVLYGWGADEQLHALEVQGSHDNVTLPFAKPDIYVAYLEGVQLVLVETVKWTEAGAATA